MGTELSKTERGVLLYKLANEYYNLAEQKKNRDFAMLTHKDKDILFIFDLDIFFTENKIELIKSVLIENQIDL